MAFDEAVIAEWRAKNAQRLIEMKVFLDVAAGIMDLVFDAPSDSVGGVEVVALVVDRKTLEPIILKHKLFLATDESFANLSMVFGDCLKRYGPTTCAVWEIAHAIEHLVDDEAPDTMTVQ